MAKILVVDDDRDMVQVVMDALDRGNDTSFASDGEAALHQIVAEHPDLIMLDLRMPGMDGALLLPMIRRITRVPVIVLSARHEQSDIVGALHAGADDVIGKPFDLADLEARVEAVLKRSKRAVLSTDGVYTAGPLTMSAARTAKLDGHALILTPIEQKILLVLTRYADQIVSREQLYSEVWGLQDPVLSKTVDVHMGRLRQRLRDLPGAPTIVTVRGRGFMLRPAGGTIE